MSFPSEQPRLNNSRILRYDEPHKEFGVYRGVKPQDPDVPQSGSADMEVTGAGSVPNAFPVKGGSSTDKNAEVTRPAREPKSFAPQDELDISPAAKMLDDLSRNPEVRAARLAQIRAAIADGTYETPDKLEAAVGRLLDEINDTTDDT